MENWLESGNEIFKVYLNCSPRGFKKVSSTHIFKLDFSSMTWVLLKSLDDHVLFLSTNMDMLDLYSRKCYSTSSAYCSAAAMGLERGCLFYTLPEDQTLYVYEVEDSGTSVILPFLELPTPWFLPTWIMMPTAMDRRTAGRRRRITDLLVSEDTTETSVEEENMTRLWVHCRIHCPSLSVYGSLRADGESSARITETIMGKRGLGGGSGGSVLLFLHTLALDDVAMSVGDIFRQLVFDSFLTVYVPAWRLKICVFDIGGSGRDNGLDGESGTVTGKACPKGLFGSFCEVAWHAPLAPVRMSADLTNLFVVNAFLLSFENRALCITVRGCF
ncbi:hypothetical protein C5167_013868 [Papaver somniferum]|uniref:DUF295 domain-containing protein n=1 Tax=Papaver somniferum TaxID=3469 RepID=A0A4Y7J5L1_PAPSO|nr:hypothetical protein C5167_013868 [Papaver somniferum]